MTMAVPLALARFGATGIKAGCVTSRTVRQPPAFSQISDAGDPLLRRAMAF